MPVPSPAPTGPEVLYANLFAGTPYRVIRRLGSGGMGEVFLVEHRDTGRELVAKLLHERYASEERLLHRLRIEAQALGQLKHEHIVSIVGFEGARSGRNFIVMEYLSGRSLADELQVRPQLPVAEAVTYACQLLSALSAAHSKGIVHRDIKPDNIFISQRPDGTRYLKVLDFGVARVLPGSSSVRPMPADLRTETGMVVGTPRYLSPEGALGQHVDERADLYAAALVLYAMLAGRGPFNHIESESMLLSAHAVDDPERPSHFAREPVPPELDAAVMRGLAKNPGERFQSADEFRDVLLRIAELLTRPHAWLQTSTFDAEALRASHATREGSSPAREHDGSALRDQASVNEVGSQELAASARDRHVEMAVAPSAHRNPTYAGLSPRSTIMLFLLAVVVMGALTAGCVALFFHGGQ